MTTIIPFDFDTRTLRSLMIEGEPWFLASDICDVLGTDVKDVRSNLDSDEVCAYGIGQRGRPPLFVSESGLYALVMKSRKPEAKAFRKWVTSAVLPALRRTGAFGISAKQEAALDVVRRIHQDADREVEHRTQHAFYRPGNPRSQELVRAVIADVAQKRGLSVDAVALGYQSTVEEVMAKTYGDPVAQARLDRKRLGIEAEAAEKLRLKAPRRTKSRA